MRSPPRTAKVGVGGGVVEGAAGVAQRVLGVCDRGLHRPASKDQAFQERVAGQAVGSVQAAAGGGGGRRGQGQGLGLP